MTLQSTIVFVIGGVVFGIVCFAGGSHAAASRQKSFDLPCLNKTIKSMSMLIPQALIGNALLAATFIFMLSKDQHSDTVRGLLLGCTIAAAFSAATIFNVKRLAQVEINRRQEQGESNQNLEHISDSANAV